MAHFTPTRTIWQTGPVFPAELADLDSKTVRSVNGDEGGLWAPSSPIVIAGAGLRTVGPFVVASGGVLRVEPGARVVLEGERYPELASGHLARTRQILETFQHAVASKPLTEIITIGPAQTTAPGTHIHLALRMHDAATLTKVVFTFGVAHLHGPGVPANLPRFRVKRLSADGVATPLQTPAVGAADTNGWVEPVRPMSGAAWHAGAVPQAITYVCDQANVIDIGRFVYVAEVIDEDGANAFPVGPGNGNVYISAACFFEGIHDLRGS